MYSRNNFKIKLSHLFMIFFIICLSLTLFVNVHTSLGNPEYTYYGVVPSKIYRYYLNDYSNPDSGYIIANSSSTTMGSPLLNGAAVAMKSLLAVVASEDSTNVKVYDLTLGKEYDTQLNSMQKYLGLLDNGTHFKVVADKQVSVLLLNYQHLPTEDVAEGPIPRTFYTDVNGLYVGKQFVLMSLRFLSSADYTVLAVEKAAVTVTKDDGTVLTTFSLEANSYKFLILEPFRVYKIESSSGNIMVQSGSIDNNGGNGYTPCFLVPSAQGGFVGTFFLTKSVTASNAMGWDFRRDYGYRIEALEDAHVQVYDLDTKQVLNDFTVKAGTGVSIQPTANVIAVQSSSPITLSMIHNGSIGMTRPQASVTAGEYSGYGHGVMFMSIQPNQNTMIYLPTEAYVEAYFFANEETQLTIDGETQTLQADSAFLYNGLGTHTVQSDKNVVLQINFWPLEPEYQGLWYTGAAIPNIETAGNNPTVTLTPLGEGFLMTYIIIGAGAAAAVVIVAVLLIMRKRS
jgi:hypothetical protein